MKTLSSGWWIVALGALAVNLGCLPMGFFGESEVPGPLKEPRVVRGEIGVEKILLGRVKGIGDIEEVLLAVDAQGSRTLAVAGNMGALTMELNGETRDGISYVTRNCGPFTGGVRQGDLDGDGKTEFVWVSWDCGLVVVNSEGERLWMYSEGDIELHFAVGDLDGDGSDEILVFLEREEQESTWLAQFSSDGEPVLVAEEEHGGDRINIEDVDGDGTKEIVYAYWGRMVVRDAHGTEVLRYDSGSGQDLERTIYFANGLQLAPWPPGADVLHGATCTVPRSPDGIFREDRYEAMDSVTGLVGPTGELAVFLDSPLCGPYGGPGGKSVLGADGQTYLAMIANHLRRASLYVWDENARLVYHEIIEPQCAGMALL
ncbi:VCBS repeat-containing protein, partial [bacterium]|nr:VCBS repeat-containing protein [bacterium]